MYTTQAILAVFLTVTSSIAAAPRSGEPDQPRVLIPAPEDARHAHLAWPKLVRCKDNTLILACCADRFHGTGGEACPAVAVSKSTVRRHSVHYLFSEIKLA